MKTEISNLITALADKSLTFGCLCQNNWSDSHLPYYFLKKCGEHTVFWSEQFKRELVMETKRRRDENRDPYKILGHPILKCHVEEKYFSGFQTLDAGEFLIKLARAWQPLGLTRSLQSIFEGAEWEEPECRMKDAGSASLCSAHKWHCFPTQPEIRELFSFLLQLNLIK